MASSASTIQSYLSSGYNQISTRVANLRSAGWQTYQTVIFAARTVMDATADLATFGSNATNRDFAIKTAGILNREIAVTYTTWIKVLNPSAKIDIMSDEEILKMHLNNALNTAIKSLNADPADLNKTASRQAQTLLTPPVLKDLAIKQQNLMDSLTAKDSYWINRNVIARLAAPLSALAMIVAGVVCTTFGVLAALVSFTTGGLSERVNSYACQYLSTPAWMLNQLHQGLLGIVRPDLV